MRTSPFSPSAKIIFPIALSMLVPELAPGDVVMTTRLDRFACSTRDLLNTLTANHEKKAGFRSLGDIWADITTAHGRLMLTVLGGLAKFERELIRIRTGEGRGARQGERHQPRPQARRQILAHQGA
jgi:DNA invertase Pin-like site-specific DNA recombinase